MGNTSVEICPPEVARNLLGLDKSPPLTSDYSMDMWSLGCMFYQLVTQRQLLEDLQPGLEMESVDTKVCLLVWAHVQQEQIDELIHDLVASRQNNKAIQQAGSLLGHLLQVRRTSRNPNFLPLGSIAEQLADE